MSLLYQDNRHNFELVLGGKDGSIWAGAFELTRIGHVGGYFLSDFIPMSQVISPKSLHFQAVCDLKVVKQVTAAQEMLAVFAATHKAVY